MVFHPPLFKPELRGPLIQLVDEPRDEFDAHKVDNEGDKGSLRSELDRYSISPAERSTETTPQKGLTAQDEFVTAPKTHVATQVDKRAADKANASSDAVAHRAQPATPAAGAAKGGTGKGQFVQSKIEMPRPEIDLDAVVSTTWGYKTILWGKDGPVHIGTGPIREPADRLGDKAATQARADAQVVHEATKARAWEIYRKERRLLPQPLPAFLVERADFFAKLEGVDQAGPVLSFIKRAPNVFCLRRLYQNLDKLPVGETAVRRELMQAIDARARSLLAESHGPGRELARIAKEPFETQLWVALDTAMALASPHEASAWLALLSDEDAGRKLGLLPEVRVALVRTLEFRAPILARELEGESRHAGRTFVGPQTMGNLIQYVARRRLQIIEEDKNLERCLAALPPALRQMVERQAKTEPLLRPQMEGQVTSPSEDVFARWEEVAYDWYQAGLPMVDDADVNAYLNIEREDPYRQILYSHDGELRPEDDPWASPDQSGLVLVDPGYGLPAGHNLSPEQIETWRAVKLGELYSPNWPPRFIPQPSKSATVLELCKGLCLRNSPTIDNCLMPLVAQLPEGEGAAPLVSGPLLATSAAASAPVDTSSWPACLKAILPRLLELPTHAMRRDALPYLLIDYITSKVGRLEAGADGKIELGDIKHKFRDSEPEVVALYVEAAPDQRAAANAKRELYDGELENKTIRDIRRFAPRLFDAIATRKPPSLPALGKILEALDGELPLEDINLIGVQHLLEDTASAIDTLVAMGLPPWDASFLEVPYSINELSAQRPRNLGVAVDSEERRDLPYDAWREAQACQLIRRALARASDNGKPIVGMDDGGYLTKALHEYFAGVAHVFTIVEQTTRGDNVARSLVELLCDVISVARSEPKTLELPAVAASVRAQLLARLVPYCEVDFLPGLPAVVSGYGWIGSVVCGALAEMGRDLIVIDPDPGKRAQAEADAAKLGVNVRAVASAEDVDLNGSAIVAGTTGKESFTKEQLKKLKRGQVVFSCSSSNVEFGVKGDSHFHEDLVISEEEALYILLGAGFPINFSGKGVVGSQEYFQYTVAAMVLGVLQARNNSSTKGGGKVQPLDQDFVRFLMELAKQQGHAPAAA